MGGGWSDEDFIGGEDLYDCGFEPLVDGVAYVEPLATVPPSVGVEW